MRSAFALDDDADPLVTLGLKDGGGARLRGRIEAMLDERLEPVISRHRLLAGRRAATAVADAFDKRRAPDAQMFAAQVMGTRHAVQLKRDMTKALNDFGADLGERFASRRRDVQADLALELFALEFDVNAGRWQFWTGTGLGLGGPALLLAATGVGVPFVVGGLLLSAVGSWLRKESRKKPAEQRRKAEGDAKNRVAEMFAAVRQQSHAQGRVLATRGASAPGRAALLDLRSAVSAAEALRAASKDVRDLGAEIKPAADPRKLLSDAARLLEEERFPGDANAAGKLWLGEDWLEASPGEVVLDRESIAWPSRGDSIELQLPARGAAAGWLSRATGEAAEHPRILDALLSVGAVLAAPPAVVLCGDWSAGKTSLMRRLLCEENGFVDDPELRVGAEPTTEIAMSRRLGALEVVDTPGLESSNAEHLEIALAQIASAALILHMHVPAFGSTQSLERGPFATAQQLGGAAGRLGRSVHALTRADELGVSPERAPDAYSHLLDAKLAELSDALRVVGTPVSAEQILAVAADPRGRRGRQQRVERAAFDGTRAWDGATDVLSLLRRLEPELLEGGREAAALDAGAYWLRSAVADVSLEADRTAAQVQALESLAAIFDQMGARLARVCAANELALRAAVAEHVALRRAELQSVLADDLRVIEKSPDAWAAVGVEASVTAWAAKAAERFAAVEADLEDELRWRTATRKFRTAFAADYTSGGAPFDATGAMRDTMRAFARAGASAAGKRAAQEAAERMSVAGMQVLGRVVSAALGILAEAIFQAMEEHEQRKLRALRVRVDRQVRDAGETLVERLLDGADGASGVRSWGLEELGAFNTARAPWDDAYAYYRKSEENLSAEIDLAVTLAAAAEDAMTAVRAGVVT